MSYWQNSGAAMAAFGMRSLNRVIHKIAIAGAMAVRLSAGIPTDIANASDQYFKPLVATGKISAAACVLVSDGQPAFVKLYGPVGAKQSLWRMASVSKAFTAIAVMQLVQQGKLKLDNDINTYLKSVRIPETFPQPITIREVLTHRSRPR